MGRARRLKQERKKAKELFAADHGTIELRNPERQHFEKFLQGNAEIWRREQLKSLREEGWFIHDYRTWSLGDERLGPTDHLTKEEKSQVMLTRLNEIHLPVVKVMGRLKRDRGVVDEGSGKGKELVICGAGPSLARHAKEYCTPERDVWGCNSAAIWLYEQGYPITHGFSVDQTNEMLIEWKSAPPMEYLLATTVSPHLTEYLLSKGRKVRFFHNYVGMTGEPVSYDGETMSQEDWKYSLLMPTTMRAGSGLNSVNRAIDLALYMHYEKIYVLGMDCAIEMKTLPPQVPNGHPEYLKWLESGTVMHANGDSSVVNGASSLTMVGEVDGMLFLTKPDMIVSAVWAVKTEQLYKGQVEIVGSDLIDRLRNKDDNYLRRLPTLTNHKGEAMFPSMEAA